MTYQEAAEHAFGQAVSFDPQILRSYDHDLGEMPRPLMALIQHRPHTVVVARSAADVATALSLAKRYDVPVTPRGQASAGYGGAIPSRGGMVLDLSNCNRILAVDADKNTVDVEPGVVWEDLSRALAPHGLDNRVCPTSAPSSTVGGWFAMGGVGIGSLRYGSIRDSVLEIDVAGLDGAIHTFAGADMEPFHQTCGGLGVITRLRLACRPAEAILPLAVRLPDAAAAARFLETLATTPAAYSASLVNAGYCALRAQAEGHRPAITSGFLVSIALLAPQADTAAIARLASDCGGEVLDDAVAAQEWEGRYYPMRIKKIGPSALVGEFFIPFEGFAATSADLTAALPDDAFGLEAFAVRGGKLAVLVYILDDAKALLYPLRMAKAMIPLRLAARHGGAPYATGMWFSALAKGIYGPDKYERIARLKTARDSRDLLNPGSIGGPWLPFLPIISLSRCILWGTACLAPLAARLSYTRRRATKHPGATA
ncbi:FAD-binding oxidoreductase [Solidesulfovibrio sp.]|uniref:FAD-binding oxidoreductase n=1 Tax=Solidesulfovibrio sp. TaxID=2910990 RepID=UPI002B1F6067|nr:FAD-binding oxidoreductase [Solidesulfovibrio sp.]MEA4857133.1 FAD-binding oxidoreductase [Solidesulfovibrio sp.]